jgi:hypothetical protein
MNINFEIFNFQKIKNFKNSNELFQYGNKEINNLTDFYFSNNFQKKYKVDKNFVLSE